MSKIISDYSKCDEYRLHGSDKNFSALLNIIGFISDQKPRSRRSHYFSVEHNVRIYPDRLEISRFSNIDIGLPPRTYYIDDLRDIRKGYKVSILPTALFLAMVLFSIFCFVTKIFDLAFGILVFSLIIFALTGISRCIWIIPKKGFRISLDYSLIQDSNVVDIIINKFNRAYTKKKK